MLQYTPAVFAVDRDYQIMVYTSGESLVWIRIGDQNYYDEANGIMRSIRAVHRITVPMDILDQAKGYTVCERELIERKPYFPTSKDTSESFYEFRPVPDHNARAYHLADVHNKPEFPIKAAVQYGEIDFLILNGDIPNHSGETENFKTIYEIAEQVTHGNIPIVFARGNHDLRGFHAEEIADYTPNCNGYTYYTFRLGSIWGLILDCGEDKPDDHPEYGLTVACHPFRLRETSFIRKIIRNASSEYLEEGIENRIVIVHNPFVHKLVPPFDIEPEIYSDWAKLLREEIKPNLMICGHLHTIEVHRHDDPWCAFDPGCSVAVASYINNKKSPTEFIAGGFTFEKDKIRLKFTDQDGKIQGQYEF